MTALLPSIANLLYLAVGLGAGIMGYRWMLKRDPAKLEAWALKIRQAGEKIKG